MSVLNGKIDYPEGILEELSSKVPTTTISAGKIAAEVGNPKTMNIILLGALVKSMGLEEINWDNVKARFAEVNKIAFRMEMEKIAN
jgi:indolepyruvate ferredoxin oxidoreductase beta subunit